jgi:hypothetical protein
MTTERFLLSQDIHPIDISASDKPHCGDYALTNYQQ